MIRTCSMEFFCIFVDGFAFLPSDIYVYIYIYMYWLIGGLGPGGLDSDWIPL